MQTSQTYDVIAMGRSSIDLYSNDIGAPFEAITSFAAYVGGCPTNVSVGARRLGLRSALLTAMGDDQVGSFILHFLHREGVDTQFVPRKPGRRSSAVLLGIEPPDRFPLTYYRDHCADIALTIDDVLAVPLASARILFISGTGLSQEPSRSATMFAAEAAHAAGAWVVLDLDFRPDQWHDYRAFGVSVRAVLRLVDVVIGTEDEINAAVLLRPEHVQIAHSQMSGARVGGDVQASIRRLLDLGPRVLTHKRGASGVELHVAEPGHDASDRIAVTGFAVQVQNVLGAGDAFAAGFLYGLVHEWGWARAARLGNACGAMVVMRHGCANFMPTYEEVMTFVDEHGGW